MNIELLDEPIRKAVVYLDAAEFRSTWLGNKSIYRTRMAIADGGELIVLAPGVKEFGEDRTIDRLIRKYGYVGTDGVLRADPENERTAGEPRRRGAPDPRFVGRPVHHHLLSRETHPRRDRGSRTSATRKSSEMLETVQSARS